MDPTLPFYVGFIDGASRWFPNLASVACVFYPPSHEFIHIDRMCVGVATNNQDEYDGVARPLAVTLHLGIRCLDIFLESELLVAQLNKCYKVCDPCLFRKILHTRHLVRHFESISFMNVPRSINSVTDQKANDILEWQINHCI